MNTENVNKLLPSVEEGVELFVTIGEAREDGNITWIEWFRIARKGGDFFDAFKDLKGMDISEVSEHELREVASVLFGAFKKEVKFFEDDIFDFLMVVKHGGSIVDRHVGK